MTNIRNALMQAAGTAASGDPVYVEEVFSTNLYTGNNSAQTITTGLDISGEGGTIWFKQRVDTESHRMLTTTSGTYKYVQPDVTDLEYSVAASNGGFGSVTSTGFTLVADDGYSFNKNNKDMVAWSFRKQAGFFDIQTASLDSNGFAQFNHNLGAAPGMVLVKPQNFSDDWYVYHKSTGTGKYLILNTTAAAATYTAWGNVSATTFDANIGFGSPSGKTVVAYFFADGNDSNAQIFGDNGDEAIVKCGTFTTSSTWGIANAECGFEPQWVMYKRTDDTEDWQMIDNMRGCATKQGKWNGTDDGTQYSSVSASNDQVLKANTNAAEANEGRADFYQTGFAVATGGANDTYIFIAIRRGPMKEPSAGTDVYKALAYTGTSASSRHYDSGLLTDMFFHNSRQTSSGSAPPQQYPNTSARLFYKKGLATINNNAQFSSVLEFDKQTGIELTAFESVYENNGTTHIFHMFRRYPKVFDVVLYTGNGSARTINHNLGVTPEMIIKKRTDSSSFGDWIVWVNAGLADADYIKLHSSNMFAYGEVIDSSENTASVFGLTDSANGNLNGSTNVAYLFASLDGISKVGTYTGTGNDLNVTGLGASARFILIKRTDASGDWYVFDSTRGIVSGDDPYLLINSTGIEVTNTDYIDPHSSGFTITSSAPAALNASGGTYLYLAFA